MSTQPREATCAPPSMLAAVVVLAALLATPHSAIGSPEDDARSNAKTALKLANDELQKRAGPDQRVTARADILDAGIARPNLTGVWNSWEIKATSPPQPDEYEAAVRHAKFIGWLVSNHDAAATTGIGFASQAPVSPVTLMGAGSLGSGAPASRHVTATKVPVASPAGAYAWAVLDEGVKVRINTPFNAAAASTGAKTMQLGSGERPGTEFIESLGGLGRGSFESGSSDFADFVEGIGNKSFVPTAERLAPGSGAALKSLAHDVTLHSLGLFTDTARGGLKQDFHLLTNSTTLPPAYQGRGVYNSRLGLASGSAPSDPRWESLHQFGRLYRDKITSADGVPVLKAQGPAGWRAYTTATPPVVERAPPPGVVLLPTIAKVQMIFSLLARDYYNYQPFPAGQPPPLVPENAANLNGPLDQHFRGTIYDYGLHLLYTPVVTLHNPYNVALEFKSLRVEFSNVPFAMRVFRNGIAQSTGLVPLETMYGDYSPGTSKLFGMNLKTKVNGLPGTTTFRLLPGEVKLFSPYIDPDRTWQQDLGDRKFWDLFVGTGLTNNINAIPGWRGDGVGFSCDWLAGSQPVNGLSQEGHWASCLGLAREDEIHIDFAPLGVPASSNNKFVVKMSAALGTSSAVSAVSAIEMDYEAPAGLQNSVLGPGNTLRFPATGTIKGMDLVDHSTRKLKDIVNVKPFAMLSVQAKSTSGGMGITGLDGRFATKPWCFAHANIGASTQKVTSEHSANFSHEFDFRRIESGVAGLLGVDAQDRGNFISGHGVLNGVRFGTQYDIPLAPIQTLGGLNGANPGGSSGYLPRFAHPIGNSWAHPLINPVNLLELKSGGNYPDHSFLLNLALQDGFYFSGLADRSGPFGGGASPASLAAGFAEGTPLDDPRLILYRPDAQPASALGDEVAKTSAYASVAAWQLMAGSFNINSTSVPAWKAMLAAIHDSQAVLNQLNKTAGTSSLVGLNPTAPGEARFSRFRLPVSTSAADGAPARDAYWLGPREYSGEELQTLAENIVGQVRLRGPFLSMAEFVNRRLSPASDEKAQRGALQQAIDDSNLNPTIASAAGAGFEIPLSAVTGYNYLNPAAGAGPSHQGAPGYLTQADILGVLGNAASARSDTFIIRSYGEAHGSSGETTAMATCEALVQRLPDWYDPADKAETAPADLLSQTNRNLGRTFRVLAFRWLDDDEI